jgi:hypothetical protein
MLASITPLGERSRRQRYPVTLAAFTLAAASSSAAAGAAAGLVGRAVLPAGLASTTRLLIGLGIVAAAVGVDAAGAAPRIPSLHRQVDERWLRVYRGWVYAAGYGAQLGVGVATLITTAAIYAMYALAVLTASPELGAVLIAAHGAGRAVGVLGGVTIRTQRDLLRVHAALRRFEAPAATMLLLAEAGIVVALAGAAAW